MNWKRRIALVLYYVAVAKLPNSRYWSLFNKMRVWYMVSVVGIMKGGEHNVFEESVYIGDGSSVAMGRNCQINEHVFLQGGILGNYVLIAPNVAILSSSHAYERSDMPIVEQGKVRGIPPVIEDDVWIGRNAVIMPGVRIGRSSIVGAGAVVTKDVEPFSVVGGVPARLLRRRTGSSVGAPGKK